MRVECEKRMKIKSWASKHNSPAPSLWRTYPPEEEKIVRRKKKRTAGGNTSRGSDDECLGTVHGKLEESHVSRLTCLKSKSWDSYSPDESGDPRGWLDLLII